MNRGPHFQFACPLQVWSLVAGLSFVSLDLVQRVQCHFFKLPIKGYPHGNAGLEKTSRNYPAQSSLQKQHKDSFRDEYQRHEKL